MKDSPFSIQTLVSAPFGENSIIIWRSGRSDCLVVDPGFGPEEIIAFLEEKGLAPAAILNTHGHSDHIAGNAALKERWPECPLVIGRGDAAKLTDARLNLSADFGFDITSPPADRTVGDGERLTFAGIELEVREIAGHSAGHVVYVCAEATPPWAVVGDVIFAGSVGRSDFYDGDFDALAAGIRQKLFTLPDDTILMPGHGPATTVGRERRTNPFVGE